MAKEKNNGKNKNNGGKEEKKKNTLLTSWTKRWIKAILMFLVALVVGLSFVDRAGNAGQIFMKISRFLVGEAVWSLPLFFVLGGMIFIRSRKKGKTLAMFLAISVCVIGASGVIATQNLALNPPAGGGGWVGFLLAKLVAGLFGPLVANITFGAIILIGGFIFLQFIWLEVPKEKEKKPVFSPQAKTVEPIFRIKGVEQKNDAKSLKPRISLFAKKDEEKPQDKKPIALPENKSKYQLPPLDLLSKNETAPTSGNIKENSLIIKKTLENFGIPVEMAEVNVGPAVTQYAFKPAEGVKLSKITTLSNNLALALAAHPIRIEAPIPGKSLVGVEVPNKVRAMVAIRNLIADSSFQNTTSGLPIALGKDVSGQPAFTDITEMPHLLVAGATGAGKTIYLNSLILSLLYKNTPDTLRMIMVDPKRVEFQHYNDIPHLLCPVIYEAGKTINALQWLTREMERRFEIFSEIPTRNIKGYNSNKSVLASGLQLPYIVLVVDELADLMVAKGKELEAGIVRLAQMARATGIHLVLATQRPSVEVITGLIKANVPSRISFQVASQVDSRTVLDTAGAEKLLGLGDMLFLSSKSSKIPRIQGPYVSEKEIKRVADWISDQGKTVQEPASVMVESLKNSLEQQSQDEKGGGDVFFGDDDPLFEEVKKIVLETKKASASFLQRRLRIGYSRAARLIDMLEEQGIVGPADGAKPREVYGEGQTAQLANISGGGFDESETTPQQDGDWQKV